MLQTEILKGLQRLTLVERLKIIEAALHLTSEDLQMAQPLAQPERKHLAPVVLWADKEALRYWIDDLFAALSIQGAPVGALALQQRMEQAGLMPNELSRAIVEAREE